MGVSATLDTLYGMTGAIDEPILTYNSDQFLTATNFFADDVGDSEEGEHFQGAAFTVYKEGGIGSKPAWFGRETAVLFALESTASPVT